MLGVSQSPTAAAAILPAKSSSDETCVSFITPLKKHKKLMGNRTGDHSGYAISTPLYSSAQER